MATPKDGCVRRQSSVLSRMFVSVELMEMRPRARQLSSQVFLKASIVSVLLLSVLFIVIYSFALMYVSDRMRHGHDGSSHYKSKHSRRGKFKPMDYSTLTYRINISDNTVVKWRIETHDDIFSEKPRCAKESRFIVLIASSPENSDRRKAIRNTWCKPTNFNLPSHSWQCVFLLGKTNHKVSEIVVENEMLRYGDILQGSYMDTYRNLSIKILHGLYWTKNYCPIKYVLKTDDDCFVNTILLYKMLTSVYHQKDTNLYVGLVYRTEERLRVIRSSSNRWSVPFEIYPETHYPPYATGTGYVLSLDLVEKMVDLCRHVDLIPVEDAYIGILANKLGVTPVMSGRFTLTGAGLRVCNFLYLIVVHHITPANQAAMFNNTLQAQSQCNHEYGVGDWD